MKCIRRGSDITCSITSWRHALVLSLASSSHHTGPSRNRNLFSLLTFDLLWKATGLFPIPFLYRKCLPQFFNASNTKRTKCSLSAVFRRVPSWVLFRLDLWICNPKSRTFLYSWSCLLFFSSFCTLSSSSRPFHIKWIGTKRHCSIGVVEVNELHTY